MRSQSSKDEESRRLLRKVLLVDSDLDAQGALASALRARGVPVANAHAPEEAAQKALEERPAVVLVAGPLHEALEAAFRNEPELEALPLLRLRHPADALAVELGPADALRADLDGVISKIVELSPRGARLPAQEIRGNLQQVALVDMLQLLSMNRRSGILSVTAPGGSGEVRLADGEIVDAAYRRADAEKALYRLLAEHEGAFAFSPGAPPGARRIRAPASMLLMDGMRQVDECRRYRDMLAPRGEALCRVDPAASPTLPPPSATLRPEIVDDGWGSPGDEFGSLAELALEESPGREDAEDAARERIASLLAAQLEAPRDLDELLDATGAPDLEVLQALAALLRRRELRRIPRAELLTPLAPVEQLPALRTLLARLTRSGFAPPARLILAAPERRMAALTAALRRITDALPPSEAPPRIPIPRLLGTLRLGDGVDLAVVGLPADEAFAPTWALSLPGAAAAVRLEAAGGAHLEAHCEALEVPLVDAEGLMGALDPASPSHLAALVRSALEAAAGVS